MNHEVEARFDWPLNPGGSECVIRNGNDLVFARGLRDFFEIDNFKQRIARSFDPNPARVWLDCVCEPARIGEIDISKVEIRGATSDFLEKSERAAIEIVADDDVRTTIEQVKRGGHRGQSRGKGKATRPAFEVSDAFFVCEARWIDGTRVIVALMLARALLNVS